MGMEMNNKYLYSSQFTDDQVIIVQDKEDLEYMTKKIYKKYGKWGMKINTEKTICICIDHVVRVHRCDDNGTIQLQNGEKITACKEYNYLGVTTGNDGKDTKNVEKKYCNEKQW